MSNTIKLVLCAALLGGCAPSLATVQASAPAAEVGAERDAERCEKLSRNEARLRYVAAGSAALAGGSGLTTIPVDDRQAQYGLAISAAAFGATAVTAEALRAEVAADFQMECQ